MSPRRWRGEGAGRRRATAVTAALALVMACAPAPVDGAAQGAGGPAGTAPAIVAAGASPASTPGAAATPAAAPADGQSARRAEVRFPGGRVIAAEIADTPRRQADGYMFRRSIGDDEGMVFVFPEDGFHSFWMKNTYVPLDIIWMDDTFTVVHVEPRVPPCRKDPCPGYGPFRKARYVLEVRAGIAAREKLAQGSRLQIVFP